MVHRDSFGGEFGVGLFDVVRGIEIRPFIEIRAPQDLEAARYADGCLCFHEQDKEGPSLAMQHPQTSVCSDNGRRSDIGQTRS